MRIKPDVKHIKISDFPRTAWPVSFGVRNALQAAFNFCRQYPEKMESLKLTLEYVLKRIQEWEMKRDEAEIVFTGGSQRRPLVSGTDRRTAEVTTPEGAIVPTKLTQSTPLAEHTLEKSDIQTSVSISEPAQVTQPFKVPSPEPKTQLQVSTKLDDVGTAEQLTHDEAAPAPQPVAPVTPALTPAEAIAAQIAANQAQA